MPSKKAKQKLMKHHIGSIARIIACASFLILTIIGVSSLVRAMSLEPIANENGIPAAWKTASLGNPDTITVPVTYWDQRQDDCKAANRQFEWTQCNYWTSGVVQGIVRNTLGSDGLPVPTYANSTDAWNANMDPFSMNVTGHNPVQTSDNFYRWFHETAVSKRYDREVTFTRKGKNTYSFGRDGTFPLDDVDFSKNDEATKSGHNFHFTAHLSIPMKISADGTEHFEFSGDDDVWVFLNGKLVLDIGGLHEKISGWFTINKDGSLTTFVQHVNDTSLRTGLNPPSSSYSDYMGPLNDLNRSTYKDTKKTINIGLKEGDVVNLDFFYAERSTTESNTNVTISNMNWPISADSNLDSTIVSKVGDTESNLVQNIASITNRDPSQPLQIERLAAYVNEDVKITDSAGHVKNETTNGFLPLTSETLYYTATPADNSSWEPVEISAPANSASGFNLAQPLTLAPHGTTGDTLYFRYFTETAEYSGTMRGQVNFYTSINGMAGITYDYDRVDYISSKVDTSNDHTVTIKYLYEDGSEAAPTYQNTLHKGETYAVDSPVIENHKPDTDKISGTVQDSDVEYIVYYISTTPPTPEITKHTVTIKYIYEDGTPAAESVVRELEEGSEYDVTSPDITDYTPDQTKVSGTIGTEDIEHVVVYTKNQPEEPNPPIGPTDPENPDTPDVPTPPTPPSSDIIDDNLLYLAPLGEVAFIPNTGIISDAAASIFSENFAEIILSQGFVMMMLLLFAASFATYFSLRKYISLTPATVKVTPNQKAAKTRMKSAKKMNAQPMTARKSTGRNAHRSNMKSNTKRKR